MAPRLTTASLDEAELRAVLSDQAANLPLIYLESQTRVVLAPLTDFLGPKITLPPVRWLVGRAFGPNLEIRWQMGADRFAATALTENIAGPTGWAESDWNKHLESVTKTRNMLLFGVNLDTLPPDHPLCKLPRTTAWYDIHVPHLLNYPGVDSHARRVILRGIDYSSRGLVVLTRFCALVPSDE